MFSVPGQALKELEKKKRKELEKYLPAIADESFEKMTIGGIEFSSDSTVKELRDACKVLDVGQSGGKQLLWQRLKKEAASSKLKTMVEVSKAIEKEFEREPRGDPEPVKPSPEEVARHELTHLPKASWCEACSATRGRERNFEVSEKKHDGSLISMDFKFTGTRDEENAKYVKDAPCISLVMVDQEPKFVRVIPVPSKEVTKYLIEEICRVLMLFEKKVILRTDTSRR